MNVRRLRFRREFFVDLIAYRAVNNAAGLRWGNEKKRRSRLAMMCHAAMSRVLATTCSLVHTGAKSLTLIHHAWQRPTICLAGSGVYPQGTRGRVPRFQAGGTVMQRSTHLVMLTQSGRTVVDSLTHCGNERCRRVSIQIQCSIRAFYSTRGECIAADIARNEVCCVCVLGTRVSYAKTAESIEMPFGGTVVY